MLQLLCSKRQNIMVVGDDDQSIYAFRGADSKHILAFPSLFEGVKTVALEQNYRSTQIILDAANEVIARNATRHEKRLWSSQKEGDKIRTTSCKTPEDEAQFVVERIELERAAKNLDYSDFAILYRTNPQVAFSKTNSSNAGYPIKSSEDRSSTTSPKSAIPCFIFALPMPCTTNWHCAALSIRLGAELPPPHSLGSTNAHSAKESRFSTHCAPKPTMASCPRRCAGCPPPNPPWAGCQWWQGRRCAGCRWAPSACALRWRWYTG